MMVYSKFMFTNTYNTCLYEIPKASFWKRNDYWLLELKIFLLDLGGGYVNAGSKINTQVVVWEKFQNKILT